ncbi:CLUMA_CG018353, isoform A [Clunio marinus]|uniref:CLUMA_CG018353, isoform A n=1 Tax=Clunio marinus TaxID=568069 RepID=A0A1J1IYK7_9DIPT|nr:CLUMA_CG018353, isoform A [Clunio marinus]
MKEQMLSTRVRKNSVDLGVLLGKHSLCLRQKIAKFNYRLEANLFKLLTVNNGKIENLNQAFLVKKNLQQCGNVCPSVNEEPTPRVVNCQKFRRWTETI